jgi:hypothetical protein
MKPKEKALMMDQLKRNYLSMKGIPIKNLKLRYSMAKYLLKLIEAEKRRMEHFWYPEALEWIMTAYLEAELTRIMSELRGRTEGKT